MFVDNLDCDCSTANEEELIKILWIVRIVCYFLNGIMNGLNENLTSSKLYQSYNFSS